MRGNKGGCVCLFVCVYLLECSIAGGVFFGLFVLLRGLISVCGVLSGFCGFFLCI